MPNITGWTVVIDGAFGYFPTYPTEQKAGEVAQSYRDYFGNAHLYSVEPEHGDPGVGRRPDHPADFIRPDDPAEDPEDGEQPGTFERLFPSGPLNAVHLLNLRGNGSVCGAEASTDDDTLTSEINEVTCVECFTRHEAHCESRDEDSPHYGRTEDDLLADPGFRAECAARVKQG